MAAPAQNSHPSRISRCPKRIVEGGVVGELDLGECLFDCAAFQDWNVDLNSVNPTVACGKCAEMNDAPVTARYGEGE